MNLTEKIKTMLFEDSWNKYGSEYMSHPYEQEPAPTIQPELPIAASPNADMQLTDSAPPVDDETYIPTNTKELAGAVHALGLKVPDEFVEVVYRQFRAAALDAEMREAAPSQPEEPEESVDEDITERFENLVGRLSEAYWGDIKFAGEDDDDDLEDMEDVEDVHVPGVRGDEASLKDLAAYYRDKPGVDVDKLKGTGETAVVNAMGRLMQNILKPLFKVDKDDLDDATEYLRLQFKMIAHQELGMETMPAEAPKTFQGMYFKRLIPKLNDEQLDDFLTTVIQDYKRRNKRWLKDLAQKALEEVDSERAANARWKARVSKEAPHIADAF